MTDATAVRTERREISAFSFARVRRKAAGEKPRGERLRDGKDACSVQSVASVRACVII